MEKETTAQEWDSLTELEEKMYRLGYEDAKNNREFGESMKEESNVFTYNNQEMEQLTLF